MASSPAMQPLPSIRPGSHEPPPSLRSNNRKKWPALSQCNLFLQSAQALMSPLLVSDPILAKIGQRFRKAASSPDLAKLPRAYLPISDPIPTEVGQRFAIQSPNYLHSAGSPFFFQSSTTLPTSGCSIPASPRSRLFSLWGPFSPQPLAPPCVFLS